MWSLDKIEYQGWPNCYRLQNDVIDLVVTTDVGPRIIRFGFIDGPNQFVEIPETLGQIGGNEWRLYGGHRLWHAPEAEPRVKYPDNHPITLEQGEESVVITQPTETTTGIQKQISIIPSPDQAHVRLIHRLINHNLWPVELAPWALSVMATGGTAILPLPPRGTHAENLLPTNGLVLWAYTDMADPRWTWGRRYVLLRQDTDAAEPQKIGTIVPDGWLGYVRENQLFVKKAAYVPGAVYPDMGCSMEVFTSHKMLELETLGPMETLEPGADVTHVEDWYLYDDVPTPANDADVTEFILPKII